LLSAVLSADEEEEEEDAESSFSCSATPRDRLRTECDWMWGELLRFEPLSDADDNPRAVFDMEDDGGGEVARVTSNRRVRSPPRSSRSEERSSRCRLSALSWVLLLTCPRARLLERSESASDALEEEEEEEEDSDEDATTSWLRSDGDDEEAEPCSELRSATRSEEEAPREVPREEELPPVASLLRERREREEDETEEDWSTEAAIDRSDPERSASRSPDPAAECRSDEETRSEAECLTAEDTW